MQRTIRFTLDGEPVTLDMDGDRSIDTDGIPHLSWVPRNGPVQAFNDVFAPQDGGEPSIATTDAEIVHAIFDATGARLHQLPVTAARVRQAGAAVKAG